MILTWVKAALKLVASPFVKRAEADIEEAETVTKIVETTTEITLKAEKFVDGQLKKIDPN